MQDRKIVLQGVRVHNLKIDHLEIPRERLVVITGISGSGKSSLAFDTLYAEGQRRYVESLSAYARQFLGLMEKPDVDHIEGLSPAIAIEQRKAAKNPRSTVATVTEIYDYLRLLFARIGTPHCPHCGVPLQKSTVDEMVDTVLALPPGTRVQVLAPVVRGRKGEYRDLFEKLRRRGFVRVRVDGEMYLLEEPPALDRYRIHTIEVVVDRLTVKPENRSRLADSIEQALREAQGVVKIVWDGEERVFSESLMCPKCGFSMPEPEPRTFSFNSPYGACPVCSGLGVIMEVDPQLLVTRPDAPVTDGAIKILGGPTSPSIWRVERTLRRLGVDPDTPWNALPEGIRNIVLYGNEEGRFDYQNPYEHEHVYGFEGVIPYLWRRYLETGSDWVRDEIGKYLVKRPCPACGGARLKPEALAVRIQGYNIAEVTRLSVSQALEFFENLELTPRQQQIAHQILREIRNRLRFLLDVGLGYLTLDRPTETLSGGEDQRVRLATQIGSGLTGVMYILDEPTIGLHPRDTERLVRTLLKLRDLGNTVIVVEHDPLTIQHADWIVDLGPLAGEQGGRVVAQGPPERIPEFPESLTGDYLAGRRQIPVPEHRRVPGDRFLVIRGARGNNLKNLTVRIPLGLFVVVTGVSGSGKSTLVEDTLYRALRRHFHGAGEPPLPYDEIVGLEHLDKVVNIDQSPIGRTPRSNPATYTGVFTPIRQLFASLPEARARGYKPGRFSFNVRGGRCEACQGEGYIRIEMQFLPDVYVPCEVCKGRRYNRETLEVKFKGRSIADVLEMSVDQALELFRDIPVIRRKLQVLQDVGLGYIRLGQPATTLSGGEAQRIKLARELSKVATGRTLYILDEPTVGLHYEDVRKLIQVLQRLVDKGNTVLVIEHNLDVIKSADWVIDLGPEGGDEGGELVAEGPPEEVARHPRSITGRFLREALGLQTAKTP